MVKAEVFRRKSKVRNKKVVTADLDGVVLVDTRKLPADVQTQG